MNLLRLPELLMWGQLKSRVTFDLDAEVRRLGHRRFYCDNGFAVFRSVLPLPVVDQVLERINTDLDAYEGPLPRHYGDPVSHQRGPDGRILNSIAHPHLGVEPELAAVRRALLDLYCHRVIAECLARLDGRLSYVMQGGILFYVSPLTNVHDDSWSCNTLPHGGSFTTWMPLEDIDHHSGPPFVIRWPLDLLMKPADLGIEFPPDDTAGWAGIAQEQYRAALEAKVSGMSMIVPMLRKGDLLVWGPMTPHGSLPGYPLNKSRLSLQGIYRPNGVPWGAYAYESGKHRFGPAAREERRHNDQFTLTLPHGMSW
jgi:hypothetical protein